MVGSIILLALAAVATICEGKTALLVIDVQDCFLNGSTTSGKPGSLSVPSDHIIPLINKMRKDRGCLFDEVIFSRDFHPANHISFGSTHGLDPFSHLGGKGALPLTCIKPTSGATSDAACCPTFFINGHNQSNCNSTLCPPANWNYTVNNSGIVANNSACTVCKDTPDKCMETTQAMWTDHCLQDGDSTFPPSLHRTDKDIIVKKGGNLLVDAYSAFMDNTQFLKTELDDVLQAKNIETLYVAGIATDVCVYATVRDTFHAKTGTYKVYVIRDATAAVLGDQANYDKAMAEMEGFGATIVTTADILSTSCPQTTSTTAKPTTAKPTELPTTTKPPVKSTKKVTMVLTMTGLDYDKITKDETAKANLEKSVKASVLTGLPEGYKEEHIKVTFSKGSVKANVEITPLSDDVAAELEKSVTANKDKINKATVTEVNKIPDVANMMEAGKTLEVTSEVTDSSNTSNSTTTGTKSSVASHVSSNTVSIITVGLLGLGLSFS